MKRKEIKERFRAVRKTMRVSFKEFWQKTISDSDFAKKLDGCGLNLIRLGKDIQALEEKEAE